jgi:ATP-dependent RNA helicase RhlE
MSFTQFPLDARLQQGVREMDFTQPTPIQVAAIPQALKGRDILGSAETGTGKTAAYLLPTMQKLLTAPSNNSNQQRKAPRVLILVPTRELALQVADHAERLGAHTKLRSAAIFGGVSLVNQEKILQRGVDIVIATPGRLLDHVQRRNITFGSIEVFILDEADRMLDVGFLPDIRKVARLLPRQRQTMLFSATLEPIMALAEEVTHQPVRVGVEKAAAPAVIAQTLFPVPEDRKIQALQALLRQDGVESVLVFTRTKHRANRLADFLGKRGIEAERIHGNRSQPQRTAALAGFKSGKYRVLVATDIAARGIDIEELGHVVNFDVPLVPEDYIHRVGRTGRADAVGDAFTFVSPQEEGELRAIERAVGKRLPRVVLPDFDYNAKPAGALEIPLGERIAQIRAKKAEDRARAKAKADRKGTPSAAARSGAPSGASSADRRTGAPSRRRGGGRGGPSRGPRSA